jgi:hypothetical protein
MKKPTRSPRTKLSTLDATTVPRALAETALSRIAGGLRPGGGGGGGGGTQWTWTYPPPSDPDGLAEIDDE